jgi:hypothetical protein
MAQNAKNKKYTKIPTQITNDNFNEFILPHLSTPKIGYQFLLIILITQKRK